MKNNKIIFFSFTIKLQSDFTSLVANTFLCLDYTFPLHFPFAIANGNALIGYLFSFFGGSNSVINVGFFSLFEWGS